MKQAMVIDAKLILSSIPVPADINKTGNWSGSIRLETDSSILLGGKPAVLSVMATLSYAGGSVPTPGGAPAPLPPIASSITLVGNSRVTGKQALLQQPSPAECKDVFGNELQTTVFDNATSA